MANPARVRLETLLRDRQLDHTLTTRSEAHVPTPSPTNRPALDAQLKGGLPRGHISEIVGPRSSGRTSLMVSSLSAVAARGELVALVDALDCFDPESAGAAGVDLSRLLWIRGQALSSGRLSLAQEWGGFHTILDRALKALNLVLQTGHFGLVVLDIVDVPSRVVKRVPFITWMRLQRVIEGTETVCLLMGTDPTARSAGGLTIALSRDSVSMDGRHTGLQPCRLSIACGPKLVRLFPSLVIEPRVLRARWM